MKCQHCGEMMEPIDTIESPVSGQQVAIGYECPNNCDYVKYMEEKDKVYTPDSLVVENIYRKYHNAYDGDVQGTCILIAEEIVKAIGGVAVAGYINYRTSKRAHWWVDKDGVIHDPMTDDKFSKDFYRHEEVHRDQEIMKTLIPEY